MGGHVRLRIASSQSPRQFSWERQYQKVAHGHCAYFSCSAQAVEGHRHCHNHLVRMSRERKKEVQARKRQGMCVDCGEYPQFWGIRCLLCRQRFTKRAKALPSGATRALRLYRDAERKLAIELCQANARFEIRKLLATGDIPGDQEKALRLYAGVDDGHWRNYAEVGRLMRISRERVRQLLYPYRAVLIETLGAHVAGNLLRSKVATLDIDQGEI
jgi:hypothetical protein